MTDPKEHEAETVRYALRDYVERETDRIRPEVRDAVLQALVTGTHRGEVKLTTGLVLRMDLRVVPTDGNDQHA